MPKSPVPPAGYRYGPRYRPSLDNMIRACWYVARGRERSLARDALQALASTPVPPLVRGLDRLPEEGPLVLAANHYERPGLWMAWPALLLSHLVQYRTGRELHWIAIEEWESFSLAGIPIPPALTRSVFQRAYATYAILAMPSPTAPATARAAALRKAASVIREGGVIGLMPEGDVGPTPELLEPREGVGAFLLLLAAAGARLVPVGLYEEQDRLVAQIGTPLELVVPDGVGRPERDEWARRRIMLAIRDLLPEPLWGVYRPQT